MEDRIRDILGRCGRLSIPARDVAADDNLYDAGLSSLATVSVMLAIEEEFDVEFPDSLLTRRSFESVVALAGVVARLKAGVLIS